MQWVLVVANSKVFLAATATVADLNATSSALWYIVPKIKGYKAYDVCIKPMMSDAC